MISQFFILSSRGDKIIAKQYRPDIERGSEEIFLHQVKSINTKPIFNSNGITFIYIYFDSLYFVLTTKANLSPNFGLEFLQNSANLIKNYIAVVSEENVKANFTLIYELLDEIMDFGFPQGTDTEELRTYTFSEAMIKQPSTTFKDQLQSKFGEPTVKRSEASDRSVTEEIKANELFVDVAEKLNIVLNSSGNVLRSEITGCLTVKSYMKGDPRLVIGVNKNLVVGDDPRGEYGSTVLRSVNFNQRVRTNQFQGERIVSLCPPPGLSTVMNYRKDNIYDVPFLTFCSVNVLSAYQMEISFRLRATFHSNLKTSFTQVVFPLPSTTTGVKVIMEEGQEKMTYDHNETLNLVVWNLKRVSGGEENLCRVKISLSQPLNSYTKRDLSPIRLHFELPSFVSSGLEIRFLRLEERSKSFQAKKWVRKMISDSSYACRISF
eukprot:gb/GECH01004268.1/.p1 GENE.gb/GECH01004268.1/~~gb/GECH01004268.1/.p1  ORF type:complete len:435 (+),score=98.62 gb/GECH01004268.1/:1-1305(+)